ncbi:unnamed protein product [Clonostachys rosea]|uniref:Anaphase-promoting complex subunit 4 WD40 domain-containing protein n=1 Tax=Bionectria ochroleuca TaxID=29856 RepID=A0ABY6UH01_BIOOC|nr:unnamed protein product [Clonostachys rosea]
MDFLRGRSTPSGTRKTADKGNDPRYSNEDNRSNGGRRTESRPVSSAIDASTMLQSLSWHRVNDTLRSDARTRMIEDARNAENHHFKPRDSPPQTAQPRTITRPKVSIPIEYRYHNPPLKAGSQFAVPTSDTPNIAWPLTDLEADEETLPFDEAQHYTQSAHNSSVRGSISPISPCSTRPGRNPSVGSNVSPISPIEPSLYPPPIKPLPSIPLVPTRSHSSRHVAPSIIAPSTIESEVSSLSSTTYSSPTDRTSTSPTHPTTIFFQRAPSNPPISPRKAPQVNIDVIFWKELGIVGKRKGLSKVKAMDISHNGSVVAIKHANYSLQFWNIASGALQTTVDVPTYIDAGKRARDTYEVGHSLISDSAKLAAIITNFGRTLEIWNWAKKKKLQTIDDQVDRWAADKFESYSSTWNPLAVYKARPCVIDVYTAAPSKKPYAKVRIIDLRKAEFPYVPQQLELAIVPSSHLLVAAIGPKSAKAGQPPPDREIMLVAWDISDYREVSHVPRHFVRPLHHSEIELAVPTVLVGYENTVISIWVPPSHCVYREAHPRTGLPEWKLSSVVESKRHVLVWDLSGNITHVYQVPNTVTCVSGDCRFVAYSSIAYGQTRIVIADAKSGTELQSIQEIISGRAVTELAFSRDAKLLMVGDADGNTNVFEVDIKVSSWRF